MWLWGEIEEWLDLELKHVNIIWQSLNKETLSKVKRSFIVEDTVNWFDLEDIKLGKSSKCKS